MDDDDEYEQERLANIRRNQELLKDLDLVSKGGQSAQRGPRRKPSSAQQQKKPAPRRRAEPERVQPRRVSNRLAGLEADSETVKRRAEEQADVERKAYEAAKRARHEEHDLTFLMGGEEAEKEQIGRLESTLRAIIADKPSLSVDLLEDVKEEKRRLFNGDGEQDGKHAELKGILDQMQLRSVDKAAQRRVYSMIMHPSTDKDLLFIGDKEGNVGVWEPLSRDEGGQEAGEMNAGVSWNLQVHGKSPITCLRFDPITADTLYSSSYDSTIRAQSLPNGLSTEIWSGQEDVLISIFDILAPQSHPSAFTRTPNAALDERSLWIADHRGGLCHVDLRSSSRRKTSETRRWQVCEKKIGGMSINPTYSSCISVASLDQHIRLFDVRNLQTLDTTNDAPYSARNVDAEVLSLAETHAQIAAHRAKLACTSVDWDPTGTRLVAVSYDDLIKVWNTDLGWLHSTQEVDAKPSSNRRKVKKEEPAMPVSKPNEDLLAKPLQIRHNNQTGKWLTLFRARFNQNPLVEPHFSIGSMDRKAEIWAADGTLLRTFYDEDHVTAVPAVTATHPRRIGRLATGNASGKCTFWAPLD